MNRHFDGALVLYGQKRYELARGQLEQMLAEEPGSPWAHGLLGQCEAALGRFDAGVERIEEAIRLAPDESQFHYALADVVRKQWMAQPVPQYRSPEEIERERRRWSRALHALREAIRLDPTRSYYFALLGRFEMDRTAWPAAQEAVEHGLAIDPAHSECLYLRSYILRMTSRLDQAHEAGLQALEANPEEAEAHNQLGWALLHRGEPRAARPHFEEALRLRPTNVEARRGLIEAIKGRFPPYRPILRVLLWATRHVLAIQRVCGIATLVVPFTLARLGGFLAPGLPPLVRSGLAAAVVAALVVPLVVAAVPPRQVLPLFDPLLAFDRAGRAVRSWEQRFAAHLLFLAVPWWLGLGFLAWLAPVSRTAGGPALVVAALVLPLPMAAVLARPVRVFRK